MPLPPGVVIGLLLVLALSQLFYAFWPYARRSYLPALLMTAAGVLLGQGRFPIPQGASLLVPFGLHEGITDRQDHDGQDESRGDQGDGRRAVRQVARRRASSASRPTSGSAASAVSSGNGIPFDESASREGLETASENTTPSGAASSAASRSSAVPSPWSG